MKARKIIALVVILALVAGFGYLALLSAGVPSISGDSPGVTISLATPQSTAQVTSSEMVVNAGPLNVRSGPGTQYEVIGTLYRGNFVHVESVSDEWCKIKYKSSPAFVYCHYLSDK